MGTQEELTMSHDPRRGDRAGKVGEVTLVRGNAADAHVAVGRRSLRVLIVDDEREVADSLYELVSSWGHEVRGAYDGATGLEMAAIHQFEVVLLDIAMPGMDGHELAHELRRDTRLKGCFLVAMRAGSDQRDRSRKEMDIDLFLAKPIDVGVLETLLLMEGERLDGMARHNQSV
jgi:CheY-like chemotaxis protein